MGGSSTGFLLQRETRDSPSVQAPGRAHTRETGAGKSAAVLPGERVFIWYDPADPQDILVRGHDGRKSDLVFVIAGAALVAAGAVIGIATL